MHGNRGCKRPRIETVQVMGTIAAIVKKNANQMPHQMRGIKHRRVDTLKYLLVGNNWKGVMVDANEVRVIVSRISCIGRSPDGCHSLINNHFSFLHYRLSVPTS